MNFRLLYAIAAQVWHCLILIVLLGVLVQTRSERTVWGVFMIAQSITFYLWVVLCTLAGFFARDRNIFMLFVASWFVSLLANYAANSTYDRDIITACALQTAQVRYLILSLCVFH